MTTPLLGGLSPTRFLREIWHKRPLLIRNAIPGFAGLLSPAEMRQLACRDDVESRLIRGSGSDWQLDHGPFRKSDFRRLPETEWTLLVQSLNQFLPEADALLARFNFIPHARLDDLMASYAVPGGSVGPHFDSYDVFLLQGQGHRRWQISTQTDLALIDDAPLKILRRFKAEDEWVLGPGDMLYLPPHVAHYGVAVDACMTYSIGFRAPAAEELAHGFLMHLQDTLALEGRYADRPAPTSPPRRNRPGDAGANRRHDRPHQMDQTRHRRVRRALSVRTQAECIFRPAGHPARPSRLRPTGRQGRRGARSQVAPAVCGQTLFHQW